jgi:predicted enzyme related to lactoylglutathione lyase
MAQTEKQAVGAILWRDLTVPDAESIRQFYCEVVGWKSAPQDMGGYNDFNIIAPETGETVAGISHARGENARVPPQWLIYIAVADVEQSIARCRELGGRVVDGPRMMAGSRFCVIQDPAGAVAALMSPA